MRLASSRRRSTDWSYRSFESDHHRYSCTAAQQASTAASQSRLEPLVDSLWKICQPGRVWKPTLLEDLTDPRNGGRIGRSGRVKAISRRVAAVWPRGAYPWMPRGLWRLPATENGPWGRPWRVPRTLLRSSALRRSAGKSASLLLLCLPRNLCNSNSHPRCC